MAFSIEYIRPSGLYGFIKKSKALFLNALIATSSSAYAVIRITGSVGLRLFFFYFLCYLREFTGWNFLDLKQSWQFVQINLYHFNFAQQCLFKCPMLLF